MISLQTLVVITPFVALAVVLATAWFGIWYTDREDRAARADRGKTR